MKDEWRKETREFHFVKTMATCLTRGLVEEGLSHIICLFKIRLHSTSVDVSIIFKKQQHTTFSGIAKLYIRLCKLD